jgi:hypothetical protein
MEPLRENPDRNFSADGIPGRKEAGRRKQVAHQFRLFFAALIAQLSVGSAELWDRAERRLRSGTPKDAGRPRQPGDRAP